jgi:tetratricopeptide (TPR) repeat protein
MISVRRRIFTLLVIALVIAMHASCKRAPGGTSATQPARPQAQATQDAGAFVPGDPKLVEQNNRGVGLMGKFQYEDARQVFQSLADQHHNWLDVKVNLAIAILNRQQDGDEQFALDVLNEALKVAPDHVRARYCTGLLLEYTGENEPALEHFQAVVQADPNDAYAAYYLAKCLSTAGKLEDAIEWHKKAIAIDPYLRSPYNACSLLLRRVDRVEEADRMLVEFMRLERNPRAKLVKTVYTRMGPKAEATTADLPAPQRGAVKKPDGEMFLDPVPLVEDGDKYRWKSRDPNSARPVSITACDIEMDGDIDIFIANALDQENLRNAVCLNQGDGRFTLDEDHILASIPDVNAALWGDYDNDGLTDVYLCRRGSNTLWRQVKAGEWRDVTAEAGTSNGEFDTVDGAMVDFDHDGDLDIFCVNADGPNELLNNNLDGAFRGIAQERGIAGAGKGSRQVLPVDLDGDRDLDIIVINNQAPHDVWLNDRAWAYQRDAALSGLEASPVKSIVAFDSDSDGNIDLLTSAADPNPPRTHWTHDESNSWKATAKSDPPDSGADLPLVTMLVDVEGDGQVNLLLGYVDACIVWGNAREGWIRGLRIDGSTFSGWGVLNSAPDSVNAIIGCRDGQSPLIWEAGPACHSTASFTFSGREVTSDNRQVRSNASGIGTHFAARIDSMWVAGNTLRNSSGPGQSLQPVPIGLGGHDKIDFISIDWPDGVFQSEIDLEAGKLHRIEETQRQLSSCPVIFAWNGTKHEFVTDCLGVGGIGYMVAPGEYAPPRPWENVLLPTGALAAKDGRYIIKLGEPMEEACYLDAARLVAYDLPPGVSMTLDERMSIMGPEPTGEARYYGDELVVKRAWNDRDEDVTSDILKADLRAAAVRELDERFIGRLKSENAIILEFGDVLSRERRLMMIIDGWIEYPYSQTMFAAWQAGAKYEAPTIEALGADGQWHVVLEQFGYPAGMPRQMSVELPLEKIPSGAMQLRIRTNQEIYFDRIVLAEIEESAGVVSRPLRLASSRVLRSGFAKRTTGEQRQPYYDYNNRSAFWDTRHQRGFYTAFGAVDELIATRDDAMAIFGPGEEVHMEFDAEMPALQPGWTRRFVLALDGWCKDMDLFTKDGETIEPLPARGESTSSGSTLHERFNTRFESGR